MISSHRPRSRRLGFAIIAALLVSACSSVVPGRAAPRATPTNPLAPDASATGATAAATPAAPPTSTPSVASGPDAGGGPVSRHVFVIVMENRSLGGALRGPFISALAQRYALATNYHSVASPSLPNYLALTAGDTFGIGDDGYHRLSSEGIGQQLSAAGLSWRAYMDGMTAGCFDSPYPYALKHNPFAYFAATCPANVVPLTELVADLREATPALVWITPDLCHDGHDCALDQADAWLSQIVPLIIASPAWKADGALFIVWDEGGGGRAGDVVPLLVVAPAQAQHESARRYDHYSLLATVEMLLGVPPLGHAAGAPALSDLVSALP